MNGSFIPFSSPDIGEEEIAEVIDVLRSGWITTGPKCKRFEDDFITATGASHAISVNSATAGLHLALEAFGVGRGDKVLTTPNTFTATAEVIRYLGADPVFVDIDEKTFNISPERIEETIGASGPENRIKAIMPVHFGGLSCDMGPIMATAKKYGLKVIEDAAHAYPAKYKGRDIGAIGDATVFSFYANKNITTGEGGMITTDDPVAGKRMRLMRLHGVDRDAWNRKGESAPWYYEVVAPGFKYNLTDIAAAIGIHQLKKAGIFREKRERIARTYDKAFENVADVIRRPYDTLEGFRTDQFYGDHSWHLYVIRVNESLMERGRFINELANRGIGASVHFIPLHLHPYWKNRYSLSPNDFPECLKLYKNCVSLPIYPKMSENDVLRVVSEVTSLAGK